MLKLYLIGNLARDAEVKLHIGKTVINFTLTHNHSYTDPNGTTVNVSKYVKCAYWLNEGKQDKISQYLNKGTQVYVEGTPSARAYKNNQGVDSAIIQLHVGSLKFIDIKFKEGQKAIQQNDTQQEITTQR